MGSRDTLLALERKPKFTQKSKVPKFFKHYYLCDQKWLRYLVKEVRADNGLLGSRMGIYRGFDRGLESIVLIL